MADDRDGMWRPLHERMAMEADQRRAEQAAKDEANRRILDNIRRGTSNDSRPNTSPSPQNSTPGSFSFTILIAVYFVVIGLYCLVYGKSTVGLGAPSATMAIIFAGAFYVAAYSDLLRLILGVYFAFRYFPFQAIAESDVAFYAIPINLWIPSLIFALMAFSALRYVRAGRIRKI